MPSKKTTKESKQKYIARREDRVRHLYLSEGLEPRDIATKLVAEGVIVTKDETLESAIRLVRADVAEIRAEIDSFRSDDAERSIASNETDALERKLGWLRAQRDRQQMIADGEPMEMCARSSYPLAACPNSECQTIGAHVPYVGPAVGITFMQTPQGPMTTYKALWPAGVRQKASKDAATLAEKIAELEMVLVSRRAAISEATQDGGGDRLNLIESDMSIPELIAANLIVGTFGKKRNDGGTSGGATANA